MLVVRNEQTKLTGAYFNGAALAFLAVGVLAPVITLVSRNEDQDQPWLLVALVLGCMAISVALHLFARWFLEGLEE